MDQAGGHKLSYPDPQRWFVLEVDASDAGAGAVLSQQDGPEDKLRPCAYFSHRLSPDEMNYSVDDRELLVIKLALEERRNWLEGVTHPFIVWTNH